MGKKEIQEEVQQRRDSKRGNREEIKVSPSKRKSTQLVAIPKHRGYFLNPTSRVIYWKGTLGGKALKVPTKTKDIREAKAFVKKYKMERKASHLKLKDLWEEMIGQRVDSRAKRTVQNYDASWRIQLAPFWGNLKVRDFNPTKAAEYEEWFLKNFKGKIFAVARKHIVMLGHYLVEKGHISESVRFRDLDRLVIKKNKKKVFRVYKKNEEKALVDKAINDRTRLIIMTFIDTGCRKMEFLSRKWSDIDFRKKTISFWSNKNKRRRRVPMTTRLLKELKNWSRQKKKSKSDFLFPRTRGSGHILAQNFHEDWVRTKKRAGIRGRARVHDLRHTFALKTVGDKCSPPEACQILDMSSVIYEKTYLRRRQRPRL